MDVAHIILGLALLIAGGDVLVRGAAALAVAWRLSPLIVGLVIVGFGTSTPELVASVNASLAGAPGVAVGNVVGSNIANILLILGLGAALSPIAVAPAGRARDLAALALSAAAATALILTGEVGRLAGAALIGALAAYILILARSGASEDLVAAAPMRPALAALALLGGFALLMIGADRLVAGAVSVATRFGVDEALIGVTIVAVGTSLPELAATIAAARRGATSLAYGNILGSNVFNALGILGAAALAAPLAAPPSIAGFDIWVMLGATAALAAVAVTGRIGRGFGLAFALSYVAYLAATAALSGAAS